MNTIKDILLAGSVGLILGAVLATLFHGKVADLIASIHNRLDTIERKVDATATKVETTAKADVQAVSDTAKKIT